MSIEGKHESLQRTESDGNLRRDIEVSDAQEDHVGEGIEGAKSTGSILDDAYDSVEAFGDGVGEASLDEGEDSVGVFAHRLHELSQGLQTAPQSGSGPVLDEASGSPWSSVIPKSFELVLQSPGPVDASICLLQCLERTGVLRRTSGGMPEEEPAQALECLAILRPQRLPPLFLANFVDRVVEGLDDMESVEDQLGVGAVLLDGADESLTHVAAGPFDTILLVGAEMVKEPVDGLAGLATAHPDHAGSVQVVDHGGVFVALGIGNLVDTYGFEAPDLVWLSNPVDDSVKDIGQGRGGDAQHLPGCLLRHDLTASEQEVFETVGDAGARLRPGRIFDSSAMRRTADLSQTVLQPDGPTAQAYVPPAPGPHGAHDRSPATTLRAPATRLVGPHSDHDVASSPTLEAQAHSTEPLELQQLCDQLHGGHRSLSLPL